MRRWQAVPDFGQKRDHAIRSPALDSYEHEYHRQCHQKREPGYNQVRRGRAHAGLPLGLIDRQRRPAPGQESLAIRPGLRPQASPGPRFDGQRSAQRDCAKDDPRWAWHPKCLWITFLKLRRVTAVAFLLKLCKRKSISVLAKVGLEHTHRNHNAL